MSWPEEMSFIANSSKMDRHKGELGDVWFVVFSFLGLLNTGFQCKQ